MARSSIDEKLVRSSSQGHLLPNTNRDEAGVIAERMRSAEEVLQIPRVASDARVVTVGIGTSTVLPHEGDGSTLFDAADAATYEAKRLGRNRVESAVYPRVADVVGWACELPRRGQHWSVSGTGRETSASRLAARWRAKVGEATVGLTIA
jgi:hypothetical protein